MKKILLFICISLLSLTASATGILTLGQSLRMALENNLGIKQADNDIIASQEQEKNAKAGFLPTVQGSGLMYQSTDDILSAELMGQKLSSGNSLYSVGVNATMPLYTGGRLTNGYKLSRVGSEVSRLKRQKTARDVEIQTQKYYWRIVMLQAKIKTLDSADSLLVDVHRTVENAVRNGLKNRNDLLKVELRQAGNESDRLKLDNTLVISKKLLAQYIGLDNTDFNVSVDIDQNTMPGEPFAYKKDHSLTVSGMLENKMLGKQVEAGKLEVDMESGKQLPTIAVGVGYDLNRFWGETNSGAAVYATLQVPISDWLWGGTSHSVKSKQRTLDNARLEQLNSQQLLRINLDNLWYAVEEAYKNVGIARKSIGQAEENLRLNRNSYDNGLSTMTDLLDAELLLQQSRDKFVESCSDYSSKLMEYRYMTDDTQQ